MAQLVDKGRIVAGVEKYQSKTNGQPDVDQYGNPKMKTKWMTIGECIKWQGDDGSVYDSEKIYLQPVNVSGNYYETRKFWDSESAQGKQAPQQQQGGYQNQPQQGYQNNPQQGYNNNRG